MVSPQAVMFYFEAHRRVKGVKSLAVLGVTSVLLVVSLCTLKTRRTHTHRCPSLQTAFHQVSPAGSLPAMWLVLTC